MSVSKEEIIVVKGCKDQLDSKQKYEVNENTLIELKGYFRSSGKIKSKIYFGLKCFKENGEGIEREDINRTRESLLITSINTDGKSLTVNKSPETWNNGSDKYSNDYLKCIGFYFDGKINHLPDYLIYSAYSKFNDNKINLNKDIPKEIIDKIIPYKTIVMNHNCGNGNYYDYSAACGEVVSDKWTEYKALYKGFSDGYGDEKGKFRLGTKYVLPFIICNYNQNDDAILEISKVEIIIKDIIKFI